MKIIEARNKEFLWESGVAKIAHHSIIGDYNQGGIRYKDIAATVKSMNLKFVIRLSSHVTTNSMCLPKYWMKKLFNIPIESNDLESQYITSFLDNQLNILNCRFKLPKKSKWKGHPFYYEALVNYELLLENFPKSYESIMSIPLWFNKELNTRFDASLSKLGFNYIIDLFNYTEDRVCHEPSEIFLRNKVAHLKNILDPRIKRIVIENSMKTVIIHPFQTISVRNQDRTLSKLESRNIYDILIANKIRLPRGFLNWCLEFELSDLQIKTALNFAQQCSPSIWDRVFQYKILTNILPTNEYLKRYHVKESNMCDLCMIECDTIVHRLYECEVVSRLLCQILDTLHKKCSQTKEISLVEYLFGKVGKKYLALNHIILELKKQIFYSDSILLSYHGFPEMFECKVRALMIKEKIVFQRKNGYDIFEDKWRDFTYIYDFRGPDILWPIGL